MIIPTDQLSSDALMGIVDNFILREGTDYGSHEAVHEKKREQLLEQIRNGELLIAFDAESETTTLIEKKGQRGL